jgi:hypothetical protein
MRAASYSLADDAEAQSSQKSTHPKKDALTDHP